jgi:dual specificity tyrosine-phosphorylation-regulated kinase 2/3/4
MDQLGMPVPKRLGSSPSLSRDKGKDDRSSARKHRSLTGNAVHTSRDKAKESRRDSQTLSMANNVNTTSAAGKASDRHARQMSASSSSSSHGEGLHGRWAHTTDFSHLPPSPSSSSIQHFLRHTGSANTPPLRSSSREHQVHSSPNVAHSLLRGTQEGWSGLDDEATAEALRKLDGLTGKSARARASVSSFGKSTSLSRPGTPPGKMSGQWEGVAAVDGTKIVRRSSTSTRDNSDGKEKENKDQVRQIVGLGLLGLSSGDVVPLSSEPAARVIDNSDEQSANSAVDKTPRKVGTSARSSFTPKRGSASSTMYPSTPTTTASSRDSASLSAATSATSVSAASTRHLMGKSRRNSAGSDASSVQSSDAAALKDRVASLALAGDATEDAAVPPVPPLPKDLSTYKSPPSSSGGHAFPSLISAEENRRSHESDQDRTFSLEVPFFARTTQNPPHSLGQSNRYSQHYNSGSAGLTSPPESSSTVLKTPSKKWSFSALNLKLTGSPSSASKSTTLPGSPRSISFGQQLRKSTSKEQALSPLSGNSKNAWSATHHDAMSSAASLASISSTGSVRAPKSPTLLASVAISKTPEGGIGNRSGTDSSGSTHQPASALAPQQVPLSPASSVRRGNSSKRLTPSSIPFFRRSSSQSMQLQPSSAPVTASSPTLLSGSGSAVQPRTKASNSPPKDLNLVSSSVPGLAQKKSSVLSLGLPSLLRGSSSRRSLHADKSDSNKDVKDNQKAKDIEKEKERFEKEKQRKEDKDRSESRISVLMGRKRGKVRHRCDVLFNSANFFHL